MPVNKDLPPMTMEGDELVIGRGANAIRVKGANLKVQDASTHVRGHYPDMYPWDTPHRHPEWDVRRSHACDLHWPPDNIPVAAIPAAIRELKRIAVGGWVVNAPTSEDLLEGAVVRWDATQEMWVAALAGESEAPVAPEQPGCDCGCQTPILPDTDLPQAPNKPVTPVKLPCTDFDARLDKAPTQAISPEFMGIVIGPNAVQTHGVVRHSSFAYPARTPLYLSDTEPGRVTTKDTGVFVGAVLVPGALLLNVEAQVLDKYLVLVKEELKTKIECAMQQLVAVAKKLGDAIKDGDELNAAALKNLEDFITLRLQQLQSFLDNVNRQYEKLLIDLGKANDKLDALEASLSEAESDGGKGHVVNTIAGRDALVNSPEGTVVFVRDASDDPAVETGPATYILVGQGADGYWANITSSITIDGGDLTGIDAVALQNAIDKAHGHSNKSLLDSITSFGESGVKIGDTIIINEDGSPIGGLTITTLISASDTTDATTTVGQMAKDVAGLKNTLWVASLEELPSVEDFAEVTKDIPEGGLFTAPVDAETAFSLLGGIYNSEEWILESGTWTAPISTWYEVTVQSGGSSGGVSSNRATGGGSILPVTKLIYLSAGEEVDVVIGAGGVAPSSLGANYSANRVPGGFTSFGELVADYYERYGQYSPAISQSALSSATLYGPGDGFGGGYPSAPGGHSTQSERNAACSASGHFGAGGAAILQLSDGKYGVGNGAQGHVYIRWRDPNKRVPTSNDDQE